MSYSLQRIAALELKENITKTAELEAPITSGLLFQNFSALIRDKQFIDQIKNLSKTENRIKVTLTHKKIVVWDSKQTEIASFSLVEPKMERTQKIVSDIFKTAINCLQKPSSAPPSKPNTPIAKTSRTPSPIRSVGTPHFTKTTSQPRISSPYSLISPQKVPSPTFSCGNPSTPSPSQTSNQQHNRTSSPQSTLSQCSEPANRALSPFPSPQRPLTPSSQQTMLEPSRAILTPEPVMTASPLPLPQQVTISQQNKPERSTTTSPPVSSSKLVSSLPSPKQNELHAPSPKQALSPLSLRQEPFSPLPSLQPAPPSKAASPLPLPQQVTTSQQIEPERSTAFSTPNPDSLVSSKRSSTPPSSPKSFPKPRNTPPAHLRAGARAKPTQKEKEPSSPKSWSLWDVFRVAPEEQEHFGNLELFENRRNHTF